MFLLIEYNRSEGRVVTLKRFSDKEAAEDSRLALEINALEININQQRIDNEIVILEAESEEAIRRTHRRYFEKLSNLTAVGAT